MLGAYNKSLITCTLFTHADVKLVPRFSVDEGVLCTEERRNDIMGDGWNR